MSLVDDYKKVAESNCFNAVWYLTRYKDVNSLNMNPLEHYINYGWKEMKNPSPIFSTRFYLMDNLDVKQAGICPLLHYEKYGKREGRQNRYGHIYMTKYFNEKWYKKQYTDIDYSNIEPLEHYLIQGWRENRNPSKLLNTHTYMEANRDCFSKDINPLIHYEYSIKKELRLIDKIAVHFWGVFQTDSAKYLVFTSVLKDIYIKCNHQDIHPEIIPLNSSFICFEEYILKEYNEKCILFNADFIDKKNALKFSIEGDVTTPLCLKMLFIWSAFSSSKVLAKGKYFYFKNNRMIITSKFKFFMNVFKEYDIKKIFNTALAIMIHTKKNSILFAEFRSLTNDNSWQLFVNSHENNKNIFFITSKARYIQEKNLKIKNKMVIYNSFKHKILFLRSEKICCSWTLSDVVPTDYKHEIYLYPFLKDSWYYCPHGISYDKNSNFLTPLFLSQPKKVFCSSWLEKEYFSNHCGLENVEITGYPRMDKWSEPNSEDILFIFTYRKKYTDKYFTIVSETVKIVKSMYPERNIYYIFHPAISKDLQLKIKRLINDNSILYSQATNEEKFNEWFNISKYLITDYSSVAYDFAYKKKSISIYYMPKGFTDGHYELNVDFYKYNLGIIVYSIEQLLGALRLDTLPKELEKRKIDFYKFIDNKNTKRVLERLTEG